MKGALKALRMLPAIMLLLSGCSDRMDVEDTTFPLLLGVDLDERKKVHLYISNPVFTPHVKKKESEIEVEGDSPRESRVRQDAHSPGVFQGRKFQTIVLSKPLLAQANWFRLLDVIFRDSRNTVTDRIVVYNGSMEELIHLNHPDEPYLPMLLKGMIDTKDNRSETVKVTAQELHRQLYEKGVSPTIAEIELDEKKELRLTGSAVLNHLGQYRTSLNAQETVLLKMIQGATKKTVSLSFTVPELPQHGPFQRNTFSMDVQSTKTKIKSSYAGGKFHFDIKVKSSATLTELLFGYDLTNNIKSFENLMESKLQGEFNALIKKMQQYRVDPIGLGLYARAYCYSQYKPVQDHWEDAFAAADIAVEVDITIKAMGPVTSTGG